MCIGTSEQSATMDDDDNVRAKEVAEEGNASAQQAKKAKKAKKAKNNQAEAQTGVAQAATNPDPKRCNFFLAKKKRFCRMEKLSTYAHCAEHLTDSEVCTARTRVLCPLSHSFGWLSAVARFINLPWSGGCTFSVSCYARVLENRLAEYHVHTIQATRCLSTSKVGFPPHPVFPLNPHTQPSHLVLSATYTHAHVHTYAHTHTHIHTHTSPVRGQLQDVDVACFF